MMAIDLKEIQVTERAEGKILEVHVSGKLELEDYQTFVPEIERLIKQHGKIRVLFYMHDFQGWTANALWEDVKFDLAHFRDIERLAIVGETKWQEGMAFFCKPFTKAKVKYFGHDQLPQARQWLEEA